MKHKIQLLFIFGFLVLVLAGCEAASTPPNTSTIVVPSTRTLFAVNEGQFGNNNSTLTAILFHHDSAEYDTIDDSDVVKGMGEGNDIVINGTQVIILDNPSNNIIVMNADSLKNPVMISMGMDAPNKMAVIGSNRLLVTRRNRTSAAIIDLSANMIVDSIVLGEPSIAVAVLDNKAFITGGTYNTIGHLHVIDIPSLHQISSTVIGTDPERAVADSASGQIILGCDGIYQTTSPKIYWVNASNNSLADSANAASDSVSITFTSGGRVSLIENGILRILDNVNHVIGTPILSNSISYYEGYYDSTSNAYYLGNAGDYTNPGTIDAYSATTGALLWSRRAGIAPAHFAFYH